MNLSLKANLLAHRRNQVARKPTDGCDRSFGVVSAAKAKLVPPLWRYVGVRYYFDYLKNVSLKGSARSGEIGEQEQNVMGVYVQHPLLPNLPHDQW